MGQDVSTQQEVLIDSMDLTYLAREIDRVEDLVSGLKMEQGANITYDYHNHAGVETECGGCHTAGYHVHTSACPTYSYNASTSCHCTGGWVGEGEDRHYKSCIKHKHICNTCGAVLRSGNVHPHTGHSCNNLPINRWALGCGYQQGECEGAHIHFDPKGQ